VDLYSVSAHKIYAPKGVGALYIRKGVKLAGVTFGGQHERGRDWAGAAPPSGP